MPQINTPTASPGSQDVFVGGDVGFDDLANPANTALLRATGQVGLYMQSGAIAAAYAAGETASIAAGMAGTGPGETEVDLQTAADIGGWYYTPWVPQYTNFGLYPTEMNANINYTDTTWTTDFTANVIAARAHGITSYAPIFSPNYGYDPLDSFVTDPYYASIRAAALYGGGLTIDAPPGYFFSRGIAYDQFIYQEIQWAHENGLRVTVIISPYNDDSQFGSDAASFVHLLQWNNAIPSEYVIENYNPSDPDGVGSDTDPNSIAGVALWVAKNALTGSSANTPIPTPTMSVTAPGTVQEPSVNGGVTITQTVSSTYLAGPIYYGVIQSNGNVESSYFQTVYLNSNGTASFTVHLDHSGDYVLVENDLSTPTVFVKSTPVTITEPAASLSLSAPGTLQEQQVNGGVIVVETVTATNVTGPVYFGVISVNGDVESTNFLPVTLNANGVGYFSALLLHTGDVIAVETSLTDPVVFAESAPVTITEPAASITLSAPGTVLESTKGAGVTVTETVSTSNVVGPLYVGVLTPSGNVESAYFVPVALDANGNGTFTIHMDNSGDTILAENSLIEPSLFTKSSAVTIVDAPPTITLSAPGTVQEAYPGAGVTVTETVTTTGLSGSITYIVVNQSGTLDGSTGTVRLGSNGSATFQATIDHSGDTIIATNNPSHATAAAQSTPITITDPTPSITLSAPGTVQETYPGAGVTVTETVTTKGLSGSMTYVVVNQNGSLDGSTGIVQLGNNGSATFQAVMDHSGDTIVAANNPSNPTAAAQSAPVTITDPKPSITLSNPGTVQETSPGAGVTITETMTTTGLEGPISYVVINQNGTLDGSAGTVSLGANGSTTFKAFLGHSGDTIVASDNPSKPTAVAQSAPVTITDPTASAASKSVISTSTNAIATHSTNADLNTLVQKLYTQGDFTKQAQTTATASTTISQPAGLLSTHNAASGVTLSLHEIQAMISAAHSHASHIV